MLNNSYKYSLCLNRTIKLRLRYIVPPIALIALFIAFISFNKKGSVVESPLVIQEAAIIYNEIVPASGNNKENSLEEASIKELQKTILSISETISISMQPKDIRLSIKEEIFPIAEIKKPAKKPFLKITEKQISTNFGYGLTKKTLRVSKGDTFSKLLERGGVGATVSYNITTALTNLYNPKDMQIGQELTIFLENGEFKGLNIQKDLLHSISLHLLEDGRYGIVEEVAPTKIVSFVKRGEIKSSLYKAAMDKNIPDRLIVEMIRIYSWSIDFQRDIQSGDTFEIMYNMTMTKDGQIVPGAAQISYVSLDLKNADKISLYRYKDRQDDIGYYEPNGHSVRKALMKTPINGARLSSGFGMRKHPILGYSKMHKGMDFAAPRGTPIYAAGDGRIVYIGNKGSYGKYIRIRHHSGLETAYAHMKGFKKGLKKGSRVTQGKIIGYVGTTGSSTGPHLHYEVLSAGRQISPRKLKMQKGKKLSGLDFEVFQAVVEQTKYQFIESIEGSSVNNKQAGVL